MTARPALMPSDTPDFAAPDWISCLHAHVTNTDVLRIFRLETGNTWAPATDPISAAVDSATGADRAFIEAFVRWFNERIWGPWKGRAGNA